MDLTPTVPSGRQVVESYGARRFRISGAVYEGSVLVFPTETLTWEIRDFQEVRPVSFGRVLERAGDLDLLLLGCGPRMQLVSQTLREPLRAQGIVVEPMDTGAACRTYNVLIAEGRRVCAALIATD